MLFEIHGQFHADDLDDAFAKLARHFVDLALLGTDEMESAPMDLRLRPANGRDNGGQ